MRNHWLLVGNSVNRYTDEVNALWAAVAEPTRRRLLDALLAEGEATATVLGANCSSRVRRSRSTSVLDPVGW